MDEATLKNIRAQLDHMFKDGRSFTKEDVDKLTKAAQKFQQENPGAREPNQAEQERNVAPDGRVRTELQGGAGLNAVHSHAGEFKEDAQRKAHGDQTRFTSRLSTRSRSKIITKHSRNSRATTTLHHPLAGPIRPA